PVRVTPFRNSRRPAAGALADCSFICFSLSVEPHRLQFLLPQGLRVRRAELCRGFSGGKQSQLALPKLAQQDHRRIRGTQLLPRTVDYLSLSADRHPVLNTDDVRMLCDVPPTLLTGKDRLDLLMDRSAVGTLPSLGVVDHD